MSLLLSTDEGWIISHIQYLDKIYEDVENKSKSKKRFSLKFNRNLFAINSKFLRQNQLKEIEGDESSVSKRKRRKRKNSNLLHDIFVKEINYVKENFIKLMESSKARKIFSKSVELDNNRAARLVSREFYSDSKFLKLPIVGNHLNEVSSICLLENEEFVLPRNCTYFCADVRELNQRMPLENQFDFILMDPPWWNKSIRRKKASFVKSSYEMMYNEELAKLQIGELLNENGLIAVWCTHSLNNLHFILDQMFPLWNVTFRAKWYWVKVTQLGKVVCDFNETHGKQPYELLIIGTKNSSTKIEIPTDKLIISVPSAMHSHKPPLTEIMTSFLPTNPKCLEIFARYLLPNWTSWGFEALKFQHISFFTHPFSNEKNKKIKIEE